MTHRYTTIYDENVDRIVDQLRGIRIVLLLILAALVIGLYR